MKVSLTICKQRYLRSLLSNRANIVKRRGLVQNRLYFVTARYGTSKILLFSFKCAANTTLMQWCRTNILQIDRCRLKKTKWRPSYKKLILSFNHNWKWKQNKNSWTCSVFDWGHKYDGNEKLKFHLYEYKKNCINNILQTVNKHSYISLHQRPTRTASWHKIPERVCRVSSFLRITVTLYRYIENCT